MAGKLITRDPSKVIKLNSLQRSAEKSQKFPNFQNISKTFQRPQSLLELLNKMLSNYSSSLTD